MDSVVRYRIVFSLASQSRCQEDCKDTTGLCYSIEYSLRSLSLRVRLGMDSAGGPELCSVSGFLPYHFSLQGHAACQGRTGLCSPPGNSLQPMSVTMPRMLDSDDGHGIALVLTLFIPAVFPVTSPPIRRHRTALQHSQQATSSFNYTTDAYEQQNKT